MISRTIAPRWIPLAIALAIPPMALAGEDTATTTTKNAYLGVRMQEIEGGLAEALGMKEDGGVLIGQVIEGSPAAQAGLEGGDIVVKVDGSAVGTPEELRALIRGKSSGESIKVEVLRDSKSKTVAVTLGEQVEDIETFAPPPPGSSWTDENTFRTPGDDSDRKHGYLGVMTQPVSKELADFFGVSGDEGALVSEVVAESPAAKLGLRAGDVITKIDGVSIDGPGELARAVRKIDEAKEVNVEWVRERRVRSGKVAVEVREGGGPGSGMRGMRGFPRRFERMMPREFRNMKDEDVQAEVDALRNELEALRTELRKLQEKK